LHTKIELQQKLLRSQMNPHFIFNAMTSIQNFIYKEEPQKAADYLSSVFKLMRSILEGSKHEYVSLEKEISTLRYYLILQQLCYQHKFDFVIDVDAEMDTENINVPPMIAQPFIENAIEHGISNKTDGKGMVTIRLKHQGEKFRLEIEDNGIGREKANEINKHRGDKHLSVATNITQERITLLNGNGSKKISMKIIDLRNGAGEATGTKVVFEFPLHELT
jgi:LytS/YehU family sensor histidine kinase